VLCCAVLLGSRAELSSALLVIPPPTHPASGENEAGKYISQTTWESEEAFKNWTQSNQVMRLSQQQQAPAARSLPGACAWVVAA